jgi:ureidoacrylate peracid hydrolase
MHTYEMPDDVRKRVMERMGKGVALEHIDARRVAFVVIDMQNYFAAEGHPAEVPLARLIVPNINRLARAMRSSGGKVVWVQTAAEGSLIRWRNYQQRMLSAARQETRLAGLSEGSEGYRLLPGLEALTSDLFVQKTMYSAFINGSSDIDSVLRTGGIDTVLIAGTLTNVCCESSARDAMMLDYKVAMISDANATQTDAEHAASLNTFAMFFGDVMTTGEAISRIAD